MAAQNLSPNTERTYLGVALLFEAFLARRGADRALSPVRREHVEALIADQLDGSGGSGSS